MINRSTIFMVVGTVVGQPLLWMEKPLTQLGAPTFYVMAAAMIILFLIGIALWLSGDDKSPE